MAVALLEQASALMIPRHQRLGRALVRRGLITREQLQLALEHQQRSGFRLGYHLVKLGFVDEADLGGFLAERFGVPMVDEESLHVHTELLQQIPYEDLKRREVFPLHQAGNVLTLVMADPSDRDYIRQVEKELGVRVHPVVAPQSTIQKYLARYFALQEIKQNLGGNDDSREITKFFTRLKDYRFRSVLGVGGFGIVCRCWQVSLDRPVAIKTLSRRVSQIEGMEERFKREGKTIARLHHPNIIQVYEQGATGGLLYIVMEYFEGHPLDEYCRNKDLVEIIGCLASVCDALHYAYRKGVVHRDIKPANVLANESGEVKLLDFGVAWQQDADERLTRQNVVLGTPKYMAPECFQSAHETSTLSDIYALGVVAYELLTRKEHDKSGVRPPDELNPDIPPLLAKTIVKALEPDKNKRLKSFDLFKRALIHSREQLIMGRTLVGQRPTQAAGTNDSKNEQKTQAAAPANAGEELGNCYTEQRVLRDDDAGRVVLARHKRMNRDVVIKYLPRSRIDTDIVARLREIKHPAVGQLLGSTVLDDRVVILMEYLEGGTLAERMAGGAASEEDFVVWCEAMTQALEAARSCGVAHGRLHPGNILFTPSGQLKVVDFAGTAQRNPEYPRYSRPEIRDPWEMDRYALGVMWFELLTGEKFRGATSLTKNFEKVQRNREIESALKVPLGRLWGMQRYGRQYETYEDMLEDLTRIREKISPSPGTDVPVKPAAPARRGRSLSVGQQIAWLSIGLAAVVGLGVLAYFLSH